MVVGDVLVYNPEGIRFLHRRMNPQRIVDGAHNKRLNGAKVGRVAVYGDSGKGAAKAQKS